MRYWLRRLDGVAPKRWDAVRHLRFFTGFGLVEARKWVDAAMTERRIELPTEVGRFQATFREQSALQEALKQAGFEVEIENENGVLQDTKPSYVVAAVEYADRIL